MIDSALPRWSGPSGFGANLTLTIGHFSKFLRGGRIFFASTFFASKSSGHCFTVSLILSMGHELTSATTSMTRRWPSFAFTFASGYSANILPITEPGFAFPSYWKALKTAYFTANPLIISKFSPNGDHYAQYGKRNTIILFLKKRGSAPRSVFPVCKVINERE